MGSAALTAELGRPLRERDKALIANTASLIVRCEQLHVQIVNGAEVDDDQLIRLTTPRRGFCVPSASIVAT